MSIETEVENPIDEASLFPAARAIGTPKGLPIEIHGETWLLAYGGVAQALDEYRDRLDDSARINDQVDMPDVYAVAQILLMGNYQLTFEESLGLLGRFDPKELVKAVMTALFGYGATHQTYTQWMMSSLYAAGLDPEAIPSEWIPLVLTQLVYTRRVMPIGEFTDAAIAAPKLKAIRARAKAEAEAKAAREAAAALKVVEP